MLYVKEIAPTRGALRDFVRFPLTLYKDDPNYVLPSVEQQVGGLLGRHNALISNGVQSFLMAFDGETPVGRLLAGIDFRVNQRLGERRGYISLFECIDSQEAADALFDAAKKFLKLNGITSVIGPSPAMFDDFGAGLLLEGFDTPTAYLSPYNPPYYAKLFDNAGFTPYRDNFAYDLPLDTMENTRYESVLHLAGKRFGYRVQSVDLRSDLKQKSRALARVIAESTPPEWEVIPPTSETLYRELKNIRRVLWPDFSLMAYAGDRPIGLLLIIPDCNPILKGLKGRVFPVGTFRMLFWRSYIRAVRTVMLYVVPEYQNKGVEAVMIQQALDAVRRNNLRQAEASMIHDKNLKMRLAVEKLGGSIKRVYREYRIEL